MLLFEFAVGKLLEHSPIQSLFHRAAISVSLLLHVRLVSLYLSDASVINDCRLRALVVGLDLLV